MITLSEDKALIEEINKGLKKNMEEFGFPYCPCVPQYKYISEDSADYVCMCKEFREMEEGECHCGKFIKTKD